MKEKQNNIKSDVILTGLSYGEHVMNADRVVTDLKEALDGCANSFVVRCQPENPMNKEMFLTVARYAKENNMHFSFLYAYQHPPFGRESHLTPDIIAEIREIAGELFLGEMFGESGSANAAVDENYFSSGGHPDDARVKPFPYSESMSEARRTYVGKIKEMTDFNKKMGLDKSLIVEATALQAYALEGGITVPVLEVLPGDPEKLIAATRGAAIGYERELWGGFIAHEWYGGYRHEDALKVKRLDLTYKYLYLSGANIAYLESGNTELKSFGYEYGYDSELCKNYRRQIKDFHKFATENPRLKHGPYTKVAFVFGEDDGYTDFMGGSVWEQFNRESFGKSDAEHAWRILSSVYRSPDWHDPYAFDGDGLDLGHAPAYGMYDIIPARTPVHVMKNYSHIIFLGHNTMSRELYERLTEYVRGGGILLMSVAHLSESSSREPNTDYINGGDLSSLFGCRINGYTREDHGVKFERESNIPAMKYPGTLDLNCDPIFFDGYADYAILEPTTAEVKARLAASFDKEEELDTPVLLENKLGQGVAMLTSHRNYPGHPSIIELYKLIVKLLLTASHATADLKVTGCDKVRFSLFYDDNEREELCLLNTMYDAPAAVTVHYKGSRTDYILAPCELKVINM